MKRTLTCCSLALVLLISAAWSQANKTTGADQAVAALEQRWLQSQQTNNPDLLTPLLAEKYVTTSSDGKVTGKAETLAVAKSTKWSSADYDDVKVTVFGNTAIATGGFKAKVPTPPASLSTSMSAGPIPG
jgi:uncharacterized protein DUF4440